MQIDAVFLPGKDAGRGVISLAACLILLFVLLSVLPAQAQDLNLTPGIWSGVYETRHDGEFQANFEVVTEKDGQGEIGITMVLPDLEEARYTLEKINLDKGTLAFMIKTGKVYKLCKTKQVESGGYEGVCLRENAGDKAVATRIVLTPPKD